MKIEPIYRELYRRAKSTGQDRAITLDRGARLAVRVRSGVVTLTIARQGKPVGDTEVIVFRRECSVPPDAQRVPADGQGTHTDASGGRWLYVAYTWKEQP